MEKTIEKGVLSEHGKKMARIIFNALLIAGAGTGVALVAVNMGFGMAASTFTIQSNLLCMIAAGVTLAREIAGSDRKGKAYIFLKGMTLTSILLTFVVYGFVLKPHFSATTQGAPTGSLSNDLLHVVVPLMTLADFLVFEEKGSFRAWHPFGWTAFPLYYVGYTVIYKAFGGVYIFTEGAPAKFPYFFLDHETYGLGTVGIWGLLIAIGFIGFSYALVGLDKLFAKIKRSKTT
ncbi:MAG: Pr6Pr family membrane protein [Treponema sp.]|nr:Pr6Pr family membrane protein [Treponema sp.]